MIYQQKRLLNDYNAKIRTLVGEELKATFNMQAFYWMMNKTAHIIEYLPESEYRKHNNANYHKCTGIFIIVLIINAIFYMNRF